MSRLRLALCALISAPLLALAALPAPVAEYRFDPPTFKGDSSQLIVRVSVPEEWHIQSNAPLDSFLIPTVLRAEGEGLVFGKPVYPKPALHDFPALGGKVAVFEDVFEIRVPVKKAAAKKALPPPKITLRYQACNHTQCLPPKEVTANPAVQSKSGVSR